MIGAKVSTVSSLKRINSAVKRSKRQTPTTFIISGVFWIIEMTSASTTYGNYLTVYPL